MENVKYPKIIIPYAPDSINKVITYGKNINDLVSLKHKWQDIATIYINNALSDGDLPEKFRGLLTFKFKLYFGTKRRRDEDNFFVITKAIIDEFVRSGFVEDDCSEYVHFGGLWLLMDPGRPRIEVYITESLRDDQIVKIENYDEESTTIRSIAGARIVGNNSSTGESDQIGKIFGFTESVEATDEQSAVIAWD